MQSPAKRAKTNGDDVDNSRMQTDHPTSSTASTAAMSTRIAAVVAQHYSQRPNMSRTERTSSPTFQLKVYNNWIKSILINEYLKGGDYVLDICSGKGGDLDKWSKRPVGGIVFAGIAGLSVCCDDSAIACRRRWWIGRGFTATVCAEEEQIIWCYFHTC
jgi:hypothetical protein